MPINLALDFSFNRVVWICTLTDDELGPTRRMAEDVEALCKQHRIGFHFYHATSRDELRDIFGVEKIRGGLPLMHLDGHGSDGKGLRIDPSNEVMPFPELMENLRAINVVSGNNLLVVSALCHGLQAVRDAGILDPSPYFAYFGTASKITVGELEAGIAEFYRRLLSSESLDEAVGALPQMALFHCQELLFGALLRYRVNQTRGKGASKRIEKLISQAKAKGVILLGAPVGGYRRILKAAVKDHFNQAFLDNVADRFLIGRSAGFTLEDLDSEIKR